jgi:hypothetical protein
MDSSNFQPPVRRSLSNEELEVRVNQAMTSHTGVEGVMELLVAQESLRAQEDQEESRWIAGMEANGSPEALAALRNFLSSRPGYVPIVPAESTEAVTPEPAADMPEQVTSQPQTFNWLNPSPSMPVVEEPKKPAEPLTPSLLRGLDW